MSHSQEQSLDENVVFLPLSASAPEFLHSEQERHAVEKLLNEGQDAFYSLLGPDPFGCFLSPEEVSQISSWTQNYQFSKLHPPSEEDDARGHLDGMDFCSTYFPSHSDVPTPNLDLGWPVKLSWLAPGAITVHTSPPAEGERPIREIIRRNLQNAKQVIAIVTDRLTDATILGDLHNAASRGVSVYVILNQRSAQENFSVHRLRHPHIRVRLLGGKSFCSKTGRMVVGDLKNNFILVDLETVIHGSYSSLTWTDAHLHRQLVTVITGSVVETFDKEFRILFAASLPVPDTLGVEGSHVKVTHQMKEFTQHSPPKRVYQESHFPINNPPPPPVDTLLDWEAMGVVQREHLPSSLLGYQEDNVLKKVPQLNNTMFESPTPLMDGITQNGFQCMKTTRRPFDNTPPVTTPVFEKQSSWKTERSPFYTTTRERMKEVENKIQQAVARRLSEEKSDDRPRAALDDRGCKPLQNTLLSSSKRREWLRMEPPLAVEHIKDEVNSKLENNPSSTKPVILRMPQAESFSSLSDIMKRIHSQQSSVAYQGRPPKFTMSEMSRSMMDLSEYKAEVTQEEKRVPVPRFNSSYFDPDQVTPAFTLMQKRNDDIKSSLYRTPKSYLPRERPRSSYYGLNMNWRSLAEKKEELE
ncbi:protein FAM83D isoform X2 [Synchiropus splendidus]|uniref:protein FAM83D isoform X2 n=1 Tax=Synchiropus splendidus TaxID=270530 RepID=UPI00237EBA2C|nr:protein FAM83D isoform X2 [Synchiropus splendidus]